MLLATLRSHLSEAGIRNGRLLVAVSGGRDSVVLLHALARLREDLDLELVVGHVHHGLRGDDADADQAFVSDVARGLGLRFDTRRVDTHAARRDRPSRTRPSLEEAARTLRREGLEAMAEAGGARWIATAHHLGDQAETVMLRILRGTAPDGLAAMAPVARDGRWVRPLLGVAPEAIAEWADQQGLAHREDASNADRAFARNRLRHDWLPGLAEAFNPNLLRNLANLAEAERSDLEWIEALVAEAAQERIERAPDGLRLAIDGWDRLPEALARRLVRYALVESGLGRDLNRAHIARVLAFLRRGRAAGRDRRLELPGGVTLRRDDESFRLARREAASGMGRHGNATVSQRE